MASYSYTVPSDWSGFLTGDAWGTAVGGNVTLTYSFGAKLLNDADYANYGYGGDDVSEWTNFAALTAAEQDAVEGALAAVAAVAGIAFTEITEGSAIDYGEIRLGKSMVTGTSLATAEAWVYGPGATADSAGDIWLNTATFTGQEDVSEGSAAYAALLEKLCMALGLTHPSETDFDSLSWSVLSDEAVSPDRYPTTLMPYDIAALQYVYGANTATNADDTVYTYAGDGAYWETIWDGGGTDTIVYWSSTGGVIDLNDGSYSQLGTPITYSDGSESYDTVAIAFGADIENATGGAGDDTLIGNELDNVLDGGDGTDVAVYAGSYADYALSGIGTVTVSGADGTDTLSGIEILRFADGDYAQFATYSFVFTYNDGDWYSGYVAAPATAGYEVGDTIAAANGVYTVTGMVGSWWQTGSATAAVYVDTYYDAESATAYTPSSYAAGAPSGVGGLGSEVDYAGGAPFGAGEEANPLEIHLTRYDFAFYDGQGDVYFGAVYDDGDYGYYAGYYRTVADQDGATGYYYVYAATDVANPGVPAGTVTVSGYYDADTKVYGSASATGANGLGSESGWAWNAWTYDWFGFGYYEADLDGTPGQPVTADTIYYFYFSDAQGDFYYGYVYDDGSYGYYVDQRIQVVDETGAIGTYTLYAATPLVYDSAATGYVGVTAYYDAKTATWYSATGSGTAGIASESGWAYAGNWTSFDWFGYGVYEADMGVEIVYSYVYYADSGDAWYGSVYDDGAYGYAVGDVIDTAGGVYAIYGSYALGYDATYTGLVTVDGYYDSQSGLAASASAYGLSGLGSESGWAYSGNWASFDWFGAGSEEADLRVDTLYFFTFTAAGGDVYSGYVYDDGTYGYAVGQTIAYGNGSYLITDSYALDYDSTATGYVGLYSYYDSGSGLAAYASGYGLGGLGSEVGWAYTENWASSDWFAYGVYEADLVTDTVYDYIYYAADGDAWSGQVTDDGTYGYAVGDVIAAAGGEYVILSSSAPGDDVAFTGYTTVTAYYDSHSGTAAYYAWGEGWSGLGSEGGWIYTSDWLDYDWFAAGVENADLTVDHAYYFVHVSSSGDAYAGIVYDDGTYGYYEGYSRSLTDEHGGTATYSIYDSESLGYDSWETGYVLVTSYYDAESGLWGSTSSYGYAGLGSETGTATAGTSTDWFGFGIYDADLT